MAIFRNLFLLGIILLACSPVFAASDFYVISSTHKKQSQAQNEAAAHGGWVLSTNFYPKLSPDLFAVVRGPYRSKAAAEAELATLKSMTKYKGSLVKEAGEINAASGVKKISPIVLAALLGEIRIETQDSAGATNACEPQEAYKNVSLHYFTTIHDPSEKNPGGFKSQDVALDFGSLVQLKDSGEIQRMRICAE